jgi:hypothetical protein
MAAPLAPVHGPIEARIRILVQEVFDPNDLQAAGLTPPLKARSAAFILLAHAEIEFAIEAACKQVSVLLRRASIPAISLLAWGFLHVKNRTASPKVSTKSTPLSDLATAYDAVLESNHGIKDTHLANLLVPIGVDMGSLTTEVQVLKGFGERRGDLAHRPLSFWQTTDLPSTHVNSAFQAGHAADEIVLAIGAKHALVVPLPRDLGWFRGWIAGAVRRLLDLIESRG